MFKYEWGMERRRNECSIVLYKIPFWFSILDKIYWTFLDRFDHKAIDWLNRYVARKWHDYEVYKCQVGIFDGKAICELVGWEWGWDES